MRVGHLWKLAVGGVLLASSAPAFAEDTPPGGYDPSSPTNPPAPEQRRLFRLRSGPAYDHLRTPMGVAFSAGGGVTNFVRDSARGQTGIGGFWEVRGTLGTRLPVGLDLAYIGQARDIMVDGIDPDAALVGNGGEAALRLQLPAVVGRRYLFEPYAFGGLGWTRFTIVNDDFNTSAVPETDDVMTFPVGAGIAFGAAGFLADARFTYRFITEEELLTGTSGGSSSDLANWGVGLTLGYEF